MCAASYPSKMARSSMNASLRAASLTGSQSESWEPRSTSSTSTRSTVNGTRSRTSGWLPQMRDDAVAGGGDVEQVAGAYRGGDRPARPADVDHPPARDVALESTRSLGLDLGPGDSR